MADPASWYGPGEPAPETTGWIVNKPEPRPLSRTIGDIIDTVRPLVQQDQRWTKVLNHLLGAGGAAQEIEHSGDG